MITMNQTSARRLTQAGVAMGTLAVLGVGLAGACHPQGVITKDVQNLTTGSALSKADTLGTAVMARPGDTLVYTVSISNLATGNQDQLINTAITDALPAGLTLVKTDSYNVGTIQMKQTAKRTITVKVSATTAGAIKNTACFTGDSVDHKVPQRGCDVAYVNVVVPTPTPTPTHTPDPTPTPTPGVTLGTSTVAPAILPVTGAGDASAIIGLTAMIGTATAYIKSRRRK
ncbi:MAG TPA: hypothetical protein VMT30_08465 [Candidatus Saccharimonadia bacterium]|nr:hypothetical protein [Candidatus Saccharimonadia bacterium]